MKHPENLGRYFADIVCSPHNQNVMIRFVAIAGYGKSWAALRLAYEISKHIALKKGGKPEDYFQFDKDLAIIAVEEVQRVMNESSPYHVIIADDVAAKAMNARNYASKPSKEMNAVIQTWRPKHNALITTQQAGFLVDKVWRNLFNYQIEIVQSNFDKGIVVCKVQEIVYKHNLDKTIYPFLQKGNTKYVRHIIGAPPKEWREAYEVERARQLEAIRKREEEEEKEIKKKSFEDIIRDEEAGFYADMGLHTQREICEYEKVKLGSYKSTKNRLKNNRHKRKS